MNDNFWPTLAIMVMMLFFMGIFMDIGNKLERIADALEIHNTYVQHQLISPRAIA